MESTAVAAIPSNRSRYHMVDSGDLHGVVDVIRHVRRRHLTASAS
jgi:hypothetical protein